MITRCTSATSRATTTRIASISPVTQSAEITSGIACTRRHELLVAGVVVALERHQHVDVQREPGQRRIEFGHHRSDDARGLQPPHAVQRCCRRQPDQPRELDVRAVGIDLQLL